MPVFLFRRNVHDIAHGDDLLVRFRGDDALAGGDKQHLIAAMGVHFVAGTGREVDDAQIEVVAHLRREQRLARHSTAREQGTTRGFCGNLVGFEYLRHGRILLPVSGPSPVARRYASFWVLTETVVTDLGTFLQSYYPAYLSRLPAHGPIHGMD